MASEASAFSAVTVEVAAQLVRMPPARIRRYTRLGLVAPRQEAQGRAWYGPRELARLRKIRRLRDDLGVNDAGIEIILRLIERLEAD